MITALLGPTNTGKTHRAIERMLEHATGMIGLPLRLLAREVYDKVSAKVGESAVALVTGEEQRIPPRPSYWVCTVEAMPVEREVDFVAVDEVQLAANDQRGHVFTSRLLHARGKGETWFLGAGTMRAAMAELVPTARVVHHPRLSQLRFAGESPLARLPPRSAVVAFSMTHVYELAERLRARKGGAAVVLGALSPRTRNAQVAMFQSGEVDYLVATDAIGMGLNLDCGHVAFSSLRKFDGHDVRILEDAELAQIAGRAGRWIADGTFGAIEPLEIPMGTARAIEEHRFDPVRRVRWRNDRLDFASVDALLDSLDQKPTRRILRGVADAEDRNALAHLARRDDIRGAARGERVRLLWDVCTIPDFRKLLFEAHAELLGELFLELARRGRLSDDWLAARMRGLDDTSGDVETLVARIAATRTWTYVANRGDWLDSPAEWQEETRAIEDRLSDALHARLVLRFVDARKGGAPKRSRARAPDSRPSLEPVDDVPLAVDAAHPFAALAKLRARMVPGAPPSTPGPSWIDEVVDAADDAFALDAAGTITHAPSKRAIAAIVRGASIALPDVRLADLDAGAGARSRLQRRALAFARDAVGHLLGGLRPLAARESTATVRGLVHRLEQGLGTALAADVADLTVALDDAERATLAEAGLVLGRVVVYVEEGLAVRSVPSRVALASAWYGGKKPPAPPRGGAVSFAPGRGVAPAAYLAVGYPIFGPRAVRADVAEAAAARLDDPHLASRLGCTAREARAIALALR
jgi:ATP-dependent RNA helicase SUPV3L1/SUV3